MLTAPPIDYAAIRACLSQAMQTSIGLPSNSVVMMQPEQPVAPRPSTPFATFMLTTSAEPMGRDCMSYVDASRDNWRYSGPRMIACQFQFYGQTHDEAFGMAAVWASSLSQEPTQDILLSGGLSVWRVEGATNISSLLFTGYEARAALNATFGVLSAMTVTVGSIEHVPVNGTVAGDGNSDTIALTVDIGD